MVCMMYVPKIYVLAVEEFQDDEEITSDGDVQFMKEDYEPLEELLFDENISHPVEVCETSSAIIFSDDSFQKPKSGI